MAHAQHMTVRVPPVLHRQLQAAAEAERRTLSSLVVTLLDRGVVERAREQELLRALSETFDGLDGGE